MQTRLQQQVEQGLIAMQLPQGQGSRVPLMALLRIRMRTMAASDPLFMFHKKEMEAEQPQVCLMEQAFKGCLIQQQ